MTLAINAGFDATTINGILATQWLMSEAAEAEAVEEIEEEVEVDPEEEEDEEEGEEESDEN